MRDHVKKLFSDGALQPTLENARLKAVEEVNSIDANQLLNVSETDLISALVEKYRLLW